MQYFKEDKECRAPECGDSSTGLVWRSDHLKGCACPVGSMWHDDGYCIAVDCATGSAGTY